jgi:hypothetical protein
VAVWSIIVKGLAVTVLLLNNVHVFVMGIMVKFVLAHCV